MAKITRLNDPANPYGKKATPIKGISEEEKARRRAISQKPAARPAARPVAPKPRAPNPLMQRLNEQYMDSRHRTIENAVDGKRKR